MSCVSPVTIHVNGQSMNVPCGHCMNCRIKRQSSLEFLCSKELLDVYNSDRGASFITLTYSDDNLPRNKNGQVTLRKKDLQDFFKRYRDFNKRYLNIPFKSIQCGEYGDSFQRPHYHILILGHSDVVAYSLAKKCWNKGLIDVGPLTQGGLRYVTKYCCKYDSSEYVKALDNTFRVEHSFLTHSVGIGQRWIRDHVNDIVESNFMFKKNGRVTPYPKYVCEYVKDVTGIDYRPILKNYVNKMTLEVTKNLDKCASDYLIEQNLIREKMLIASAKSRGIVVTPEYLAEKHWIKPRTKTNFEDVLSEIKK